MHPAPATATKGTAMNRTTVSLEDIYEAAEEAAQNTHEGAE